MELGKYDGCFLDLRQPIMGTGECRELSYWDPGIVPAENGFGAYLGVEERFWQPTRSKTRVCTNWKMTFNNLAVVVFAVYWLRHCHNVDVCQTLCLYVVVVKAVQERTGQYQRR